MKNSYISATDLFFDLARCFLREELIVCTLSVETGTFLHQFIFDISCFVSAFNSFVFSGAYSRGLPLSGLEVPPNRWYNLHFNVRGHNFTFLLNGEVRNIHILFLIYDEKMHLSFVTKTDVKNYDLNHNFLNLIYAKYVNFYSKANSDCGWCCILILCSP